MANICIVLLVPSSTARPLTAMKSSSCLPLLLLSLASSTSRAAVEVLSPDPEVENRRLDLSSNLTPVEQETLSIYSKLATQQCNFTIPLSTLITAKPGDACSFRVRIGIARLGVDIYEDVTAENSDNNGGEGSGNSSTVFIQGTRNLIVWNMDNKDEAFRCFYDMTMNTTTTSFSDSNYEEVVERGDDIMIFFPTDTLLDGVENVVSAPGLYQMMNGMLGWRTDTINGNSNVTEISGEFVNLCEELSGGGGGGGQSSPASDVSATDEQVNAPPSSTSGGDPSVSIESMSLAFALTQAPWQVMMVVMIFGLCL